MLLGAGKNQAGYTIFELMAIVALAGLSLSGGYSFFLYVNRLRLESEGQILQKQVLEGLGREFRTSFSRRNRSYQDDSGNLLVDNVFEDAQVTAGVFPEGYRTVGFALFDRSPASTTYRTVQINPTDSLNQPSRRFYAFCQPWAGDLPQDAVAFLNQQNIREAFADLPCNLSCEAGTRPVVAVFRSPFGATPATTEIYPRDNWMIENGIYTSVAANICLVPSPLPASNPPLTSGDSRPEIQGFRLILSSIRYDMQKKIRRETLEYFLETTGAQSWISLQ